MDERYVHVPLVVQLLLAVKELLGRLIDTDSPVELAEDRENGVWMANFSVDVDSNVIPLSETVVAAMLPAEFLKVVSPFSI